MYVLKVMALGLYRAEWNTKISVDRTTNSQRSVNRKSRMHRHSTRRCYVDSPLKNYMYTKSPSLLKTYITLSKEGQHFTQTDCTTFCTGGQSTLAMHFYVSMEKSKVIQKYTTALHPDINTFYRAIDKCKCRVWEMLENSLDYNSLEFAAKIAGC